MDQKSRVELLGHINRRRSHPIDNIGNKVNQSGQNLHPCSTLSCDHHHGRHYCSDTAKGDEEIPRLVESGTRRSGESLEESYFAGSLLLP